MNKTLVLPHFSAKSKSYFFTIKPPLGASDKFQKVNFWSDRLRKISSTYFIVREKNKARDGYHFHALVTLQKKPTKQWFKRGYHYHVKKVGQSVLMTVGMPTKTSPKTYLNKQDIIEALDAQVANSTTPSETETNQQLWSLHQEHEEGLKLQKQTYLMGKIIDYCCKENPLIQYFDYCLVSRGRQV